MTPREKEIALEAAGRSVDPLEQPRLFRGWLQDRHGVILDRRNWSREWGWVVQELFRVCDRLDRQALRPLAEVLGEERIAA